MTLNMVKGRSSCNGPEESFETRWIKAEMLSAVLIFFLCFLFPLLQIIVHDKGLVEGWVHLGTCTFHHSQWGDVLFLSVLSLVLLLAVSAMVMGFYIRYCYITKLGEVLISDNVKIRRNLLLRAEMKLVRAIRTLFSLLLFTIAFASYLGGTDVVNRHTLKVEQFLECRITSCQPSKCGR